MKLRWALIIIVAAFIIIDVVLVSIFLTSPQKTNISFISLKPGYSWSIDKSKKENFENKIIDAGADSSKILVVMSPTLKKTRYGTMWGDGNPAYFAEWKRVVNYDVLMIYTDKDELVKIPQDKQIKLLSRFVTMHIAKKAKVVDSVNSTDQLLRNK